MREPLPWRMEEVTGLVVSLCALLSPGLRPGEVAGAAGGPPSRAEYRQLADEMDAHLRRLLAAWYPRCVDRKGGGFLEEFGPDWSAKPGGGKFIVFQARMTWVAAEVAAYAPALRDEYLGYAKHGLEFLDTVLCDREYGGVHWKLGPGGGVRGGIESEKHAYGLAFAVYAASAAYRRLNDPRALALAKDTFRWLDGHAHDDVSRGYIESLTRDGRPFPAGAGRKLDGIGTLIGCKSMNSHIHLLEAFTALYGVWPDPIVRRRLEELLWLVRDTIAVEPGCLNLFFTRDWRPLPAHDSFGHDVETAYLLVEASAALGSPDDPATWRVARKLVDHALEWGFDEENGGFYDKGEAFAPAHDTTKIWWTQAEGLGALVVMEERYGADTSRYRDAVRKQWGFIRDHQIDPRDGSWHGSVARDGKLLGNEDKASPWQEIYHNARALMNSARTLKKLAGEE